MDCWSCWVEAEVEVWETCWVMVMMDGGLGVGGMIGWLGVGRSMVRDEASEYDEVLRGCTLS